MQGRCYTYLPYAAVRYVRLYCIPVSVARQSTSHTMPLPALRPAPTPLLLQALLDQGLSVLVTSYTNSAVDNILAKLARPGPGEEAVRFVRVGSAGAVHPDIQPYMAGGAMWPGTSTRELKETMSRAQVVSATSGVHPQLLACTVVSY